MTTEQTVDTAALDSWLAEHLFGCNLIRKRMGYNRDGGPEWLYCGCEAHVERAQHTGDFREGERLLNYSTTGDGMLMVLNCELPGPWGLHWSIQQFREGYYGPWWVGCSVTPGFFSFTHPYEWARHDELPMAAASALRQAWERKQERVTRGERAVIEERNKPTPLAAKAALKAEESA